MNVFLLSLFLKSGTYFTRALRNITLFSCVDQNEWRRYAYRERDQPWSQRPVRRPLPFHHRQPATVVRGPAAAGAPARSAPSTSSIQCPAWPRI